MTYNQILKELAVVNLKNKFTTDFENYVEKDLLNKLKDTNKIHSTGSILRTLISYLKVDDKNYEYWVQVLKYFMTPIFARDFNKLPR